VTVTAEMAVTITSATVWWTVIIITSHIHVCCGLNSVCTHLRLCGQFCYGYLQHLWLKWCDNFLKH